MKKYIFENKFSIVTTILRLYFAEMKTVIILW